MHVNVRSAVPGFSNWNSPTLFLFSFQMFKIFSFFYICRKKNRRKIKERKIEKRKKLHRKSINFAPFLVATGRDAW